MITFTHDDKLVSLGPRDIIEDDHFFKNTKKVAVEGDKNNNKKDDNNSKLLIIDGILYSLYETPTTKLKHLGEE